MVHWTGDKSSPNVEFLYTLSLRLSMTSVVLKYTRLFTIRQNSWDPQNPIIFITSGSIRSSDHSLTLSTRNLTQKFSPVHTRPSHLSVSPHFRTFNVLNTPFLSTTPTGPSLVWRTGPSLLLENTKCFYLDDSYTFYSWQRGIKERFRTLDLTEDFTV